MILLTPVSLYYPLEFFDPTLHLPYRPLLITNRPLSFLISSGHVIHLSELAIESLELLREMI